MSEQTVPDIYGWIEAMRDEAVVEVGVDLAAPDDPSGDNEHQEEVRDEQS